jgi:hypothetical protein
MGEISTHPRKEDWVACVVGFPMLMSIGAVIPLLGLNYLYLNSPDGRPPSPATLAMIAFGAAIAIWFVWRTVSRQYWRLTDSELIAGVGRPIRLPLADVDKVVVGLPVEQPLPGTPRRGSPTLRLAFETTRASTLVLIFRNGLVLPLNLRRIPHGTELMTELTSRLKNRLAQSDVYTTDEIRLLRHADLNALISR